MTWTIRKDWIEIICILPFLAQLPLIATKKYINFTYPVIYLFLHEFCDSGQIVLQIFISNFVVVIH